MTKNCFCGRGFELHYTKIKQLLVGFETFCSGDCLHKYLVDNDFNAGREIEEFPNVYPAQMDEPFDYWCKQTRTFFRSKSESTFAVWCDHSSIKWKYEPYRLYLQLQTSYTPDFWLPELGHLIEVKGVWSGKAKKKMKLARQYGYPIVLVPDYLIRKLGKIK